MSPLWLLMAYITVSSQWARWCLKSPAWRLFTQPLAQVQINENIKIPRHWLCAGISQVTGEFPARKIFPFDDVTTLKRYVQGTLQVYRWSNFLIRGTSTWQVDKVQTWLRNGCNMRVFNLRVARHICSLCLRFIINVTHFKPCDNENIWPYSFAIVDCGSSWQRWVWWETPKEFPHFESNVHER